MPRLHTDNSLKQQKSNRQQLLRGLSLISQAVGGGYSSTTGTVNQSIRMGIASAFGFGGAYGAIARLADKTKKLTKGVHTLLNLGSSDSNVKEESVFTKSEETKQPGFFGIAGLAKYGFRHIVLAIKRNRNQEEKDKKNFLNKLFEGVKRLFTNKWFLGSLLAGILGFGIWSLLSRLGNSDNPTPGGDDVLENSPLSTDSDFLSDAAEEQYWQEFNAVREGIYEAAPLMKRKWQKDIEALEQKNSSKHRHPAYSLSPITRKPTTSSYKAQMSLPVAASSAYGNSVPLGAPVLSNDYWISSKFGMRKAPKPGASTNHGGVDIAVPVGTPVVTRAQGVVSRVGYSPKSGLYIKLKHDNGYETVYAHLKEARVSEGQSLQGGEVIGLSGNSGLYNTGAHLHYEVRQHGYKLDPQQFIDQGPMSETLSAPTPAKNTQPSSNNIDTGLSNTIDSEMLDSNATLLKQYNELGAILQYHIKNPQKFEKFKKTKKWEDVKK